MYLFPSTFSVHKQTWTWQNETNWALQRFRPDDLHHFHWLLLQKLFIVSQTATNFTQFFYGRRWKWVHIWHINPEWWQQTKCGCYRVSRCSGLRQKGLRLTDFRVQKLKDARFGVNKLKINAALMKVEGAGLAQHNQYHKQNSRDKIPFFWMFYNHLAFTKSVTLPSIWCCLSLKMEHAA